jgi:hypothetical protein
MEKKMSEAPEQKQRIEKAVAAALADLSRQQKASDGNLTIPMRMKHELSGHVELAIAGQLDLTELVTAILAADKSAGTLEAAKVRDECARLLSGRFAVFAFNSRDAAGGMGDLKSRHATLEDAQAAASKIKGFDYVEVEDLLPLGPPMVVDALESGLSTEKMP